MSEVSVDQLLLQAQAHLQTRQIEQARQLYQRVVSVIPNHAPALAILGEIALISGDMAEAERQLHAALAADRLLATAANNLAVVYRNTARPQLACDLLRSVISRLPDFLEAWFNLGNALLDLDDYDGAIEAFERVLRLRPDYPKALINQAQAFRLTLRLDRCLDHLRRAVEIGATAQVHSILLYYGIFSPNISADQLATWAAEWDLRFAAPLRAANPPFDFPHNSHFRDPERPLRIGYVSPHFRNSSIGWMVYPVLMGHNPDRFVLHCYSDVKHSDERTARFRSRAHVFRDITSLTDEKVAQIIRQDNIDVLIDLTLHAAHSRPGVFARSPSPIQVNYLAYPFTSGLQTMHYRVTDDVLDPPGQVPLGPETILRLRSCYWLYRANPAAPVPGDRLPVRNSQRFTFACFNYPQKLNPSVAETWARIVNQVPKSRLLLFTINPVAQRPHVERLFESARYPSILAGSFPLDPRGMMNVHPDATSRIPL